MSEHHSDWCLRCGHNHRHGPTGDLSGAIPLFEQTLSDTVQVLGKVHPLTKAVRCAHVAACAQRAVDGPKMM